MKNLSFYDNTGHALKSAPARHRTFLFCILITLLSSQPLLAQWEQTNGPFGGGLVTAIDGDSAGDIYASVLEAGVFKSTDRGATWMDVGNEMFRNTVRSLVTTGNGGIFVADAGVVRSFDGGNSWERPENELSDAAVGSLAVNAEGEIFAAVSDDYFLQSAAPGLYKSTDLAQSWTQIYNDESFPENVEVAVNEEGIIFYGGWELMRSDDNGITWSVVTPPVPAYFKINAITFDMAGALYCGTYFSGGIYRSEDNGDTWELLKTWGDMTYVEAIAVNSENEIFVSQYGLLFNSSDQGITWDSVFVGSYYDIVSFFPMGADSLMAGADGTYISTNGYTWEESTQGMIATKISGIALTTSGMLLATDNRKLWRSSNLGDSWTDLSAAFETRNAFEQLKSYPEGIFVINNGNLYHSTDEGNTWHMIFNHELSFWNVSDYALNPQGDIFLITWDQCWSSPDNGTTWQQVNVEIDDFASVGINTSGTIVLFGEYQYTDAQFRSEDNGLTWIPIPSFNQYGVHRIITDSAGNFYGTDYGLIWRSDDEGATWNNISPFDYGEYQSLCTDHTGNLYTSNDTLILQSENTGSTWTDFFTQSAPYHKGFTCFTSLPQVSYLFAGHPGRGVWRISNFVESTTHYATHQGMHIYPNPAGSTTTIRYSGSKGKSDRIEIYSTTGLLVNSLEATGSETIINTSRLTRGIYLVKMNNMVERLIIY